MKVGAVCCRHQYVYGTSMYIKKHSEPWKKFTLRFRYVFI